MVNWFTLLTVEIQIHWTKLMNYSFILIYLKCLWEKVRVCYNIIAFNLIVLDPIVIGFIYFATQLVASQVK